MKSTTQRTPEERYEALLRSWQQAPPHRYTLSEVEKLVTRRYHAEEIDLYSIHIEAYRQDPDVDEKYISKLLTITGPPVLRSIYTAEERLHHDDDVPLDSGGAPNGGFQYEQLRVQHLRGTRISVVLESFGGHVTGYRVYGNCAHLGDLLCAMIGARDMTLGDLGDLAFRYYLDCLDKNGFIVVKKLS